MPRAMGSLAAVSEIIFTIDEMLRNAAKNSTKDEDDLPSARLEYASKDDYQFQQALNILKATQIMQGKRQP